ncbi:ABC transporter permease [Mucilaginibacter psychrotolerans]|uniref:ABC transporter permease n=1 Tax=Mucilaginibacter psychrotolerans TaxID=1524096 RepID=A0A4Y8SN45_9SPHI|nr:ABC transporter permease [Mucilaginibacter psychrotolerans]TFF40100.1 ABC transporter permease [Mucilaginibacter psychrotolerans]
MLLFNLKVAFRNIRKNIVFSSVNIIGLAISMACCLIISLYVWDEWQQDTFHNNIDHIYRITEKQNQAGTMYNVAVTPGPLAPALQKDFPEIANTVRFCSWGGSLKNGQQVHDQASIQLTDNSIFKVFNFPLIKGNPSTALDGTDGIVITEKIAEQYFGANWRSNPNIIGQVFRLNNQYDFKLTGIAKNVPANSSIQFDILLPLAYLFKTDEWSYKWNSNNYHTYIQLKRGTNVTALEAKLAKRLHAYNNDTADLLLLQPLKAQYLYSEFDFKTDWGKRSNIKYIRIFLGVGLLLLIIACVNFINLSTARSLKRSVEVGVRKVTGASRKQLIFQFLIESLSLAFIAGIVAIILIAIFKPLVNSFTGANIDTGLSQSMLIPFFVGFIVIVGVLAGSYPAFVLSAFNPSRVLKTSETVRAGKFFRQTLVVGQFAISVTLIICVCFMYRQLTFMRNKDLGFDKEQVLRVGLSGKLMEKAALYKRDLDKIAGVKATSLATLSLANDENTSYVDWDGMQKDDKFLITQANVDPDFIPAMGMKLLSGSNFSPQMTNDTANFIINEASAQRMGYSTTSAVGKKVTFWGAKGTIIGVVKNFNYKPLNANIEPFIFRYQPKDRYFSVFIEVAPGKASAVIQQASKLFAGYEPEGTFQYTFLNESIDRLYKNDQRVASFILFFAGLTIFVGCLGLFGLTVFAAEQRIKEIGIRKVLGAGLASIVALLSKDFLKLIIIAIAVAVPLSRYITYKWLENYTYRITVEWWVFGIVGFAVIAVALFTISFQAIKTAAMNPVKSLRSE